MRHWEAPSVALLMAVVISAAGLSPWAAPLVALAAVSPALAAVDIRHRRLPDRMVLPGYLACAAAIAAEGGRSGGVPWLPLVSGVVSFGFLLVLAIAGGLGMGDVKLGGVLGFAAGGLGVTTAVLAPLLGFLLASGAAVLVARRSGGSSRIPFGPYLLGGFWVAVLLGSRAG